MFVANPMFDLSRKVAPEALQKRHAEAPQPPGKKPVLMLTVFLKLKNISRKGLY